MLWLFGFKHTMYSLNLVGENVHLTTVVSIVLIQTVMALSFLSLSKSERKHPMFMKNRTTHKVLI